MAMNYCNPDFDARDHNEEDFQTNYGGYDFGFRRLLFNLLPVYFKKNDTYKDENNEGLLERYLAVFGNELDREVIPAIHCYLNIVDAAVANPKFLNHLSDTVGRPPDIFQDDEIYRNLLKYIVTFYKIKGTIRSYQLFFAILGFAVEIEELPHEDDDMFYDSGGEYDTGEDRHRYDMNACLICYYYNIKIRPLNPNQPLVISTDTLNKLREAIIFNQPINTVLGTFMATADIQNNLPVTGGTPLETIKTWVDIIKARGTFGEFNVPIDSARVDNDKRTITFTGTFLEEHFSGEITSLELRKESTGYIMAYKTGLSIVKDSDSRVKINWTIKIT